MDERVLQFRVGMVVLTASIVTAILIVMFGAVPDFTGSYYLLNIEFPAAPGVGKNSPVLKSGVPIGRVTHVDLQEDGGVLLKLRVQSRYKLKQSEICRIRIGSMVTGDAVLEFVASNRKQLLQRFDQNRDGHLDREEVNKTAELLQDGDYLRTGMVAEDPLQIIMHMEQKMGDTFDSIEHAGAGIEKAADDFAMLMSNLNEFLGSNDGQLQGILTKTEVALDNFSRAMGLVSDLAGDPQFQKSLKQTLKDMPALFEQAKLTVTEARKAIRSFETMSESATVNLNNLQHLTGPLKQHGPGLAEDLVHTINSMDQLFTQLSTFSRSLNSQEGSLGKLVHDPMLFQQLNSAAHNINEASRRLRPIMEDLRIFSDKLATDPRQLGLKGALDNKPSGVGVKTNFWQR
jgi:phospholipid/cholesterol/gamma-HCH transport system substrate-binding protein